MLRALEKTIGSQVNDDILDSVPDTLHALGPSCLVLLRGGAILADRKPEHIVALPQIEDTYRVLTDLERTQRNVLYVDARLA